MTANAIAISSQLEATGMEKRTADAVASAIVDHNDKSLATKADLARLEGKIDKDIARLEGKIEKIEVQIKIMMAMLSVLVLSVIAPLFG